MVDPLDVVLLIGGLAFVLSSRRLRTSQTYAFLVGEAVVLLGANLVPEPGRFVVKATVIVAYVVVILYFQHLLVGISRSDSQLDEQLNKISADVNAALTEWAKRESTIDPAFAEPARRLTAKVSQQAMTTLDTLHPEDADWRRTVALMREYLEAVSDAATMPTDGERATGSQVRSAPALEALRDAVSVSWAQALTGGQHTLWGRPK